MNNLKRSYVVCPECGAPVGLRRSRGSSGGKVYQDHPPQKAGTMVDHRGLCFSSGHFPKEAA